MSKLNELQRLYRAQSANAFLRTNPNLDIYPLMNPGAFNAESELALGQYLARPVDKSYGEKAPHGDWLASSGDFQNEFVGSGFFVDCGLEASVINLTLQPQHSLFNLLPIMGTIQDTVKFPYLTGISDPTGAKPTAKCEPGQIVGETTHCTAEWEFGRAIYSSHTLEMDELVRAAKNCQMDAFYMVGSVRGVSAIPSAAQLQDRDLIGRSHVRKEMGLIGRAHQRNLIQTLWTGNPATGTGGFYDFTGLDLLVANDYATKPNVSGTNCAALNSDIKEFNSCIGGTTSLYRYMQELEGTLYNRAMLQGLLPVDWVWVMAPVAWGELVKYLSCEMISDSCNSQSATNVTVTVNDGSASQMRQQLMSSMRISVNGHSYAVILDSGIPVTNIGTVAAPQYESDIFFLPLRAAGENVLTLWHRDYAQIAPQFTGIPMGRHAMDAVWSDGGRFLWSLDLGQTSYCFGMTAKTELLLSLKTPQLAGRINGVRACRLQEIDLPF